MNKDSIKAIEKIYNHCGDEYSKRIFRYRLLFSLTKDWKNIFDLVQTVPEGRDFYKLLCKHKEKELVIFGGGVWGCKLVEMYRNIPWACFVDNHLKQKEIRGLPVIGFEELYKKHQNSIVIVASVVYYKEIEKQLLENGFKKENIVNIGRILEDTLYKKQYFDLPCFSCEEGESFVDVGAYQGESSLAFIKWYSKMGREKYGNIWALEPDPSSYENCCLNLKKLKLRNLNVINAAAWNENEILRFKACGNFDACIKEDGQIEIRGVKLDVILEDEKVTFIKMDVEGTEKRAIIGAEKIIREQKPKMAISIYHKPEDIWELPSLLLEYNAGYRFYLRHYSFADSETVLYAL